MPESTRARDPGFCRLLRSCVDTNQAAGDQVRKADEWRQTAQCLADGTVKLDGKWLRERDVYKVSKMCLVCDKVGCVQTVVRM